MFNEGWTPPRYELWAFETLGYDLWPYEAEKTKILTPAFGTTRRARSSRGSPLGRVKRRVRVPQPPTTARRARQRPQLTGLDQSDRPRLPKCGMIPRRAVSFQCHFSSNSSSQGCLYKSKRIRRITNWQTLVLWQHYAPPKRRLATPKDAQDAGAVRPCAANGPYATTYPSRPYESDRSLAT